MRVASNQLRVDGVEGLLDCKSTFVMRDLSQEHRLEQQVTHLFLQIAHIASFDGIDDLRRLLEHEGRERAQGLLAIPGAAVRPSEPRHDRNQPAECLRGAGGVRLRRPVTRGRARS
jgi:hypothetical protein